MRLDMAGNEARKHAGTRPKPRQRPCRHHWIIEKADGPVSMGVCKHCGLTCEFKNYIEYKAIGSKTQRHSHARGRQIQELAEPESDTEEENS